MLHEQPLSSLTWQFACHNMFYSLQFDIHLGARKKLDPSPAAASPMSFHCFISSILHLRVWDGCVILSLVTLSEIYSLSKSGCLSGSLAKDFPSLILFSHSLSLSLALPLTFTAPPPQHFITHLPLSPSATVFTWPLHVT